ncbi:DUF6520 family protein [Flavobacterium fluviatile]|uniref:DUF6520 family protein n=1 Tax=Flavobacterium fluviatile TaxID=1862387 RepID=UPI0013D6F173|nr:DUF6520 family protein [Flavobacterium fluviatile]
MKTMLKKIMPVAVFALGITGAFVTTSMQSASTDAAPQLGYILDANNECSDVEVTCSDIPKQVCRQNVTSGPQAFAKDEDGNCNQVTYRP